MSLDTLLADYQKNDARPIIILYGPTASGKSKLSVQLAQILNADIINIDAMQVYSGLPIITAQPEQNYMSHVTHHLYSVLDPTQNVLCTVARWLKMAEPIISELLKLGRKMIITGGSGMYIKALVDGLAHIPNASESGQNKATTLAAEYGGPQYLHQLLAEFDPETAKKINPNDSQRLVRAMAVWFSTNKPLSYWQSMTKPIYPRELFYFLYLNPKREKLYENIDNRTVKMLEEGAIDEVKAMSEVMGWLQSKTSANPVIEYSSMVEGRHFPKFIGFQEILDYINGKCTLDQSLKIMQQHTRNYAKRQCTWFRNQMVADYTIVPD